MHYPNYHETSLANFLFPYIIESRGGVLREHKEFDEFRNYVVVRGRVRSFESTANSLALIHTFPRLDVVRSEILIIKGIDVIYKSDITWREYSSVSADDSSYYWVTSLLPAHRSLFIYNVSSESLTVKPLPVGAFRGVLRGVIPFGKQFILYGSEIQLLDEDLSLLHSISSPTVVNAFYYSKNGVPYVIAIRDERPVEVVTGPTASIASSQLENYLEGSTSDNFNLHVEVFAIQGEELMLTHKLAFPGFRHASSSFCDGKLALVMNNGVAKLVVIDVFGDVIYSVKLGGELPVHVFDVSFNAECDELLLASPIGLIALKEDKKVKNVSSRSVYALKLSQFSHTLLASLTVDETHSAVVDLGPL